MTTAELTDNASGLHIRVGTDRRPVDFPTVVPLAEAVAQTLNGMGWQVAGDWTQTFGGITGAVWEATVEPVEAEEEQ